MLRLPGNDLSERRRSHISQESQFVLRNDCGGLARNAIYSALLMLARVIRVWGLHKNRNQHQITGRAGKLYDPELCLLMAGVMMDQTEIL